MEQPKNSRVMREHRASVPVELMSLADTEEKELDGLEEQKRVANVMCDAVDLIGEILVFLHDAPPVAVMAFFSAIASGSFLGLVVLRLWRIKNYRFRSSYGTGVIQAHKKTIAVESRSAAIAAIRDSHMASLTAQLQLMMSQLPIHIRKMPMKKFLKQHCPNTIDNTRSDGTLHFEVVQDPIDSLQTPGELLPFSSSTQTSRSQVRTRQAMHHRSESSTIHIISPDD